MNTDVPKKVGEAKVVLYSPIDQRHKHTGQCKHEVSGVVLGKAEWAAICQYENDTGYYLFLCYESDDLSDTYHETIEDAKEQAELEYEGIASTWETT